MTQIIQLGDTQLVINPIPLGRVKLLMPAINRAVVGFQQNEVTEETMGNALLCVALATDKEVTEIEAIPAPFTDLTSAIETITEVLGLVKKVEVAGEPQAAI